MLSPCAVDKNPLSNLVSTNAGDEQWSSEEGDHTMVKVLCSQRDRFRDKAHQLELQLAQVCKEPVKKYRNNSLKLQSKTKDSKAKRPLQGQSSPAGATACPGMARTLLNYASRQHMSRLISYLSTCTSACTSSLRSCQTNPSTPLYPSDVRFMTANVKADVSSEHMHKFLH